MSLEQRLEANTEALLRLAAVIEAAGVVTTGGREVAHPVEKAEKPSTPAGAKPEKTASDDLPAALTYEDIRKPFLRLVNADKSKALALLAELGVETLQDFKDKPAEFARILEAVKKASV